MNKVFKSGPLKYNFADVLPIALFPLFEADVKKIGALFLDCIIEIVNGNGRSKKAINFELLK